MRPTSHLLAGLLLSWLPFSGCGDVVEVVCQPDCVDRECGPDPLCGKSCGGCGDNASCDDGHCACDYEACGQACCAQGLVCLQGACCAPGCADDDPCTRDTCRPDGTCENIWRPLPGLEGPPDDPTCWNGLDDDCDHATDGGDANCTPCQDVADCDDDNACTADDCSDSVCSNTPVGDDTPCDDSSACTRHDACIEGACIGSDWVECPPPVECQEAGGCDPDTGQCLYPSRSDGTACEDDGLECTSDECLAGACVHELESGWCLIDGGCRSDGAEFQDDGCLYCDTAFATDGWRARPDGTACDDGDTCRVDSCQDGACTGCVNPHGSTACVAGACQPTCEPGWGDCDGDPVGGCEQDLWTATACGADCAGRVDCTDQVQNATGTYCRQGACDYAGCVADYSDCDWDRANGCESDGPCGCEPGAQIVCPQIDDPDEGECVRGVYDCVGGEWVKDAACIEPAAERCDDLDNDCDGITDSSSEADDHCLENPQDNAELTGCFNGTCVWTCQRDGNGDSIAWDLNGDRNQPGGSLAGDGCEYLCTQTIPATEVCDGLDNDCDGLTDGQDVVIIDLLCPARQNASATTCEGPRDCDYTCNSPYGDCNGDLDLPVPLPGDPPYSGDGCETNLSNNPSNCGLCGATCDSQEFCVASGCRCGGSGPDCVGTQTDFCCGTQCVDLRASTTNCGACNNTCSNAHGTSACVYSVCSPTCNSGWSDCNGDPDDGCEESIWETTNCGTTCGNRVDCTASVVHASGITCNSGACDYSSCNPGWDSCDGNQANGCETNLWQTSSCGTSCANRVDCFVQVLHASGATCASGICDYSSCDLGWDDCNYDPSDGCEQDLSSNPNCGVCGNDCSAGAYDRACVNDGGIYRCGCNAEVDCGGIRPSCNVGISACQ